MGKLGGFMARPLAHQQNEVEDVILEVLKHGGVMTTQELQKAVKARLDLDPSDLQPAKKRANETKIDQIISNALQESRNLCRKGWVCRVARGEFLITPDGQAHLIAEKEMQSLVRGVMDELGIVIGPD